MSLAANFGELRPNHYHMGLDIRTQKKENLPVHAAADGYIAKVVIEPGGFGQAIYINHPNGFTTLYAHLNKFFPALAAYVEEQQYKLQSWSVQLIIPKSLFPVRKGQQIAYSGNTGGSQGPHLHFEIRNTADDVNLNPLLFGLPVADNTPPVIQRLAVYDRNLSTYDQSPRIFAVHRKIAGPRKVAETRPSSGPAIYDINPRLITVTSSRVSFAISAFDTQSGSAGPNGIFQAILYDNDQAQTGFQMNHISYDNTRNLNAHIDYKTRATGGPFLQHLSALPGYTPPSIYRSFSTRPGAAQGAGSAGSPADGVIDLTDGNMHTIRIEVRDAYGNGAQLVYQVQFKPGSEAGVPAGIAGAGTSPAVSGDSHAASPDKTIAPGKECYPGMLDGYETEDCAFYIGEKCLYDSVHIGYLQSGYPGSGLSLPGGISAVHTIGAPYIPLQDSMLVRIRPNLDWTATGKDKVVMVCFNGTKKEVRRPEWQGGWASARFREFGNFQLVEDKEAPAILPVGILDGANLSKASRIAFNVKDNLGTIRSFRAELDGQWLCFTNDKGLAFIYKFDKHCPPGKHVLTITAEDEAGNKATAAYSFTR